MQNFRQFTQTSKNNLNWLNEGTQPLNEYRAPTPIPKEKWPGFLRHLIKDIWRVSDRFSPILKAQLWETSAKRGMGWTRGYFRLGLYPEGSLFVQNIIKYFDDVWGVHINDIHILGDPKSPGGNIIIVNVNGTPHIMQPGGLFPIHTPDDWVWGQAWDEGWFDNIDDIISNPNPTIPMPHEPLGDTTSDILPAIVPFGVIGDDGLPTPWIIPGSGTPSNTPDWHPPMNPIGEPEPPPWLSPYLPPPPPSNPTFPYYGTPGL